MFRSLFCKQRFPCCLRMREKMSEITIRDEVKPPILLIHKHQNRIALKENLEEGSHRDVSAANLTISQPVNNQESISASKSYFTSGCSIFGSSKRSRFQSSILMSKSTIPPSAITKRRSASTLSMTSMEFHFFCSWNPILFGVDEDVIPSSEEEEEEEELLDSKDDLTESAEEAEKEKKSLERKPRYGRRARAKPVLTKADGSEFECRCNIDSNFKRHYAPHFGGGVKAESDEWRTPHFVSYWEEYKEAIAAEEGVPLMKLIESNLAEEPERKTAPTSKLMFCNRKIQDVRKEALKSLRTLTCRELRRYRMPYVEAIILELEEDGYLDAASFLKSLIIQEHNLDKIREHCATLRECKTKIQKVVKLLMMAEKKGRKQDYGSQSLILLKMGNYFAECEHTWWWLAERLYQKAVEASSKYVLDDGKSEALSRYIFGCFLLDHARKVQEAREHLSRVRELSLGKDWNASKILPKSKEPIYKECCNHLCRALLETSRKLRAEEKPEEALIYVHQSHNLCQESYSRPDIDMETLMELGITYRATKQLELAKTTFKKFITKAKLLRQVKRICEGHLELAICYRMEGEVNSCYNHLRAYLEQATEQKDDTLMAFGYRYIGELLLNHGYSKQATFYLEKAFRLFLEQHEAVAGKSDDKKRPDDFKLPHYVELARILNGLAKGESLTKPICTLILKVRDARNPGDTIKLLKWKNRQEIDFELDEMEIKEELRLTDLESFQKPNQHEMSEGIKKASENGSL